ncbi:thiol:disulfide interchange protein DsbA/DsbL [Alteromonas sp. a30]|uniref:thiol:disulfide interchange protein DsbA/DsbL n=1 Tax=Alteromonas sp. a30 TaxID=2730917 RepID=UPI0022823FCF|nr:thiol:disulfide interchange protein DsbA/DsbL [Alteromonas sp. a30]MCY7294714.1 thiol:disulfide interchange protein DsbA/DsbL [Alteromonas sp. a30]
MRKYLILFALALFLPLQLAAQELYQEGKHYTVISDKATEEPQVLEFFSYWCPHCYNFEPLVAQLEKKLEEESAKNHNVDFKKVHVNFMGFTKAEIQDEATKAMMIARALKREKQLNAAIFKYIHVQRAPVTGLADLRNVFAVNGVDSDKFDKLAKSFGVNSQLKLNNKTMQKYIKHLRGVPNFIINGKYQAKFTRDMSPDQMVDLLVWLTKQK